jgi:thiol-disulfide isomerase/thioredoxin
MKNIFILFAFFSTAALAESLIPVKFENKQDQVIGKTWPGFHFNDKAPNRMQIQNQWVKPGKTQEHEIVFDLPKLKGKKDSAGFVLTETYVCDDANTVCEIHKVKVELAATGFQTRLNTTHDENGFIKDDLQKALAFAKKNRQLVLIDFGAPWCPPCLRLEAEVFPSEQFCSG